MVIAEGNGSQDIAYPLPSGGTQLRIGLKDK